MPNLKYSLAVCIMSKVIFLAFTVPLSNSITSIDFKKAL